MYKDIAKKFMDRIQEERKRRDEECGLGDFAKSATIEFLYRYWLESVLCNMGFTDLEREVSYRINPGPPEGRRKACDLRFCKGNEECWAELKVAYSNTTYTQNELNSDLVKLNTLKSVKRIYAVVFVSETSEIPLLLSGIRDRASGLGAEEILIKKPLPTPEDWEWTDSHIHIGVYIW